MTTLQIENNILTGARFIASSNCDDRPDESDISLIVIHGISLPPGSFGGSYIDELFTNQLDKNSHPYFLTIAELKVSSHLLINRLGEVTQYVPFHKRAWHAGESCYKERTCCNDFSIGIELEGTDTDNYTDAQYNVLNSVLNSLLENYPNLTPDNIVGHCDIAPGRKTDPGPAFDWQRLVVK